MTVLNIARSIIAACQPLTGNRASGTVTLTASAGITVEFGSYLYPVVNGQVRHDLLFKTAKNAAAADGGWTLVADTPTAVDIISNIGGARHNLPARTTFVIEQPWRYSLAAQPRTLSGLTGATDPTDDDLVLWNFVPFESFGASKTLELFQSSIGGRFPAALICWQESEPADGMTTSAVSRPTHRGAGKVSYSELFEILIISNRADSEHERRGQGLRVMEEVCGLLVDRMEVDGKAFSSPGGIHIRKRYRTNGSDTGFYKAFQVYTLAISAQATYTRTDTRAYSPLQKFKINAPREDTPTDLPLVVNNLVANPFDP